MMRLYFPDLAGAQKSGSKSKSIRLGAEESGYAKNVLRARPGDELSLFDGKGRTAPGVIASISRKEIVVSIGEVLDSRETKTPALDIFFLPAILKGQKMDFVVQKATELGVSHIRPLITGRTQISETRKLARWQKIAVEASRQCGRSQVPEVEAPVSFSRHFEEDRFTENERAGIIFWEGGGGRLKDFSPEQSRKGSSRGGSLEVAVGPEGGFSAEEVALAQGKGFYVASLGPRILRAETACVLAVGLVQFLLGDMG